MTNKEMSELLFVMFLGGIALFVVGFIVYATLFRIRENTEKRIEQEREQKHKERARRVPGGVPDRKEMEAYAAEIRRTGTHYE